MLEMVEKESKIALLLMKDANEKFGQYGSLFKSSDKERVITVSFEGLLSL